MGKIGLKQVYFRVSTHYHPKASPLTMLQYLTRVHAILGRHLTDAKGRLKRQILKHVQILPKASVK